MPCEHSDWAGCAACVLQREIEELEKERDSLIRIRDAYSEALDSIIVRCQDGAWLPIILHIAQKAKGYQ